jgi:hypothetical protein
MNLEEAGGVERASDRCEECGVQLTDAEMQLTLERGGPVLCTVHASELAPLGGDEEPAEEA